MNEKSIAVLPFVNMSSDPENEYFSDGITEEIINALTGIRELKVTARTSSFAFKNRQVDVRHVGNQLGVSTVLEGSIRKINDRVRISTQLIRTDDGFHIWSEKYDRELVDIFELQDEISLEIAEQIRENFGHLEIKERLVDAPTDNIEAYNLYLKARYNHLRWDAEGIENGMKYYDQCISMAPNFSWPYFGAGYCHSMYGSWTPNKESLDFAEEYIEKGFQLDSESFLGHYSRATLQFWGRWDFSQGHDSYKRSMALNPSYTEAEEGLAELYTAIGDFDRAMKHAQHILALDPLSKNHHYTIANIYYLTGHPKRALEYVEAGLKIDPNFTHLIELMQLCLIDLKEEKKLTVFLSENSLAENKRASKTLYQLIHHPKTNGSYNFQNHSGRVRLIPWHMFLYANSGNQTEALNVLEEAVTNKGGQFMNFKSMPLLEPLRNDYRYHKLVQNIFQPSLLPNTEESPDSHGKGLNVSTNTKIPEMTLEESKPLMEEVEIEKALALLDHLMNEDKKFLDTAITLRHLAEELTIHPNKLSWLLNDRLSMNFNDYINSFRLDTFKKKALDPAHKNYTLLGLAFESGFNSKSAFNDYFKKKTGTTPRRWLKLSK
ncbi:MAG: helix-turn-helix domain-containing protein [Bacteroidetes bacterium]|jgi:TolB-like protein/AraC-like DNA-binding protein|nr:helix-turn-helix domain-containing protein [Bacteroidota bacterium]